MKTRSILAKTVIKVLLASLFCSGQIYAMEQSGQNNYSQDERDTAFQSTMDNLKKLEENWKYDKTSENKQIIVNYIYQEMQFGKLPKPSENTEAAKSLKWVVKEIVNNVLGLRSDESNSLSQQLKRYLEKGEQPQVVQKSQPSEESIVLLKKESSIIQDFNPQTQPLNRGEQLAGIILELQTLEQEFDTFKSDDVKNNIISIIANKMKDNELPVENEPKSSENQGERPEDVKYVVDEILKKLFSPEERNKPNSFYKRVMTYFLGKGANLYSEDFIESKELGQHKSSEKGTLPSNKTIVPMGQSIEELTTNPTNDALNSLNNPNGRFSELRGIKDFGYAVAKQALDALNINNYEITPVPEQGWNSITFDVKNENTGEKILVAKLAKGDDLAQIQSLQKLFQNTLLIDLGNSADIKSKRGLDGIGIPIYLFSLNVNGENLQNYSMQIMPYLDRGNFTEILKRLCDDKWWDGDKNAYLKLMELFGQAIGRFQRGGQDADSKKSDMTLVHGDLFTEHVLVGNFDNNAENIQNVAPKFSLIDLPTLNYVPDPDCTKLLVDPMFLSSIVFFEFRRENFRKGILEIFNNFYLGYVKEFSEKTINKLLELFKNRETAYAAFEKAADYANSVGKDMKTRQEDKFNSSTQIQSFENVPLSLVERKNLEIQLADLHRLAFLHAYYKIMNNDDKAKEILKEEDDWIEAWNNSGLYEKLKMKS